MSSKNQANIGELLSRKAKRIKDPAGRILDILEDREANRLAREFKCEVRDIYLEALAQGIYPYRYIRNIEALSLQEQIQLAGCRVAVVGAGGLGGQVILLLARLGVGNLVLVGQRRKAVWIGQGCFGMNQVRPHADHIQVQLAEQLNVSRQILVALSRDTDHDAAADFISESTQRTDGQLRVMSRATPQATVN